MVLNSSTEVIRNIESWPQAPPPVLVMDTLLNTSFSVTVTLEERHINIVSLYIEVCVSISLIPRYSGEGKKERLRKYCLLMRVISQNSGKIGYSCNLLCNDDVKFLFWNSHSVSSLQVHS